MSRRNVIKNPIKPHIKQHFGNSVEHLREREREREGSGAQNIFITVPPEIHQDKLTGNQEQTKERRGSTGNDMKRRRTTREETNEGLTGHG